MIVLAVTGRSSSVASDIPIWAAAVATVAMWVVMLLMMNRNYPDTPRLERASLSWFAPIDFLVGVPLGVACQFVLVTAVNWPLQKIWPDTFSFDEVSKRATDLSNTAPGAWKLVLIAIVVVGAPVVEEIVYRGAVQQGLVKKWGVFPGIVVTAALFALIHLTPVEFAGLFSFALVLGVSRHRTGRLGTSIITHMAFNVAGLVMVIMK